MSLREQTYSVLVVSASKNVSAALADLLMDPVFEPVSFVSSVSAARRAFAERAADLVILNSPLPDETGTRFAIDISASSGTVVLLIVSSDLHEEIFGQAAGYGVFTLPRPLSKNTLILALNWLQSAKERLRRTEKKTLSLEERMEEIRLVNRAKWLLISELKMDEPGAHRYIEKQAMDRCVTRGEIARGILRMYRSGKKT